ncbi:MAG: replication-associated recombination protein A, partial [Pseudomonadota bacterium]|nr:replication-associated recombination protein A [Pseudomonadota bacterium]
MTDLFATPAQSDTTARKPLAEVLRPKTLAEVIGQDHLTAENDGQLHQLRRQ